MRRYAITLDASTTAGGKVVSASSQGTVNGATIALEGDVVACPACKSEGKILCVGPRVMETWNGRSIALENDLCICRCFPSPRLITKQLLRFQTLGEGGGEGAVNGMQSHNDASVADQTNFDLDFLLVDDVSGLPAVGWPYAIELADGGLLEGHTNCAGRTGKIAGKDAVEAILRVYTPIVAPLNPNWDR